MYLTKRFAIQGRLAVDFTRLDMDEGLARQVLTRLGFSLAHVGISEVAQSLVGRQYHRGAQIGDAPQVFDCSSLTRYCYAQLGFWLPRRSIQQFRYGRKVKNLRPGDLLFTKGWRAYWDERTPQGIGHVGLYVGDGKVIHAADSRSGVLEVPVSHFIKNPHYRGAVRVYPQIERLTTLILPKRWQDVETPEDIKWIVLSHLPK